jgi:hypothetical protein
MNSPAAPDSFLGSELLARQVDLDAGGEPVPPVVAAWGAAGMNFRDHQLTAQ